VTGQGTLVNQHGVVAQAQILVGYLKGIVTKILSASAISYVDLITVLIHSHLVLTAAMTH
jgi:hypothetical protein